MPSIDQPITKILSSLTAGFDFVTSHLKIPRVGLTFPWFLLRLLDLMIKVRIGGDRDELRETTESPRVDEVCI